MKQHIHFVGIKGVGMTPLAIIAQQAGFIVSGCDTPDIFITDKMLKESGIAVSVGFTPDHLKDVDVVITTGAHGGYDNPEVKEAQKRGIPVWTQGEAVGEFMKGQLFGHPFKGISITGTHGKTTTTAMIATILQEAGLSPSWVVGTADIPSLGLPGHFGEGNYFVAEADEYATEPIHNKKPKFLWQYPQIGIITNIEHDHPDVYPTIEDAISAFGQFTHNISSNGILIACGDSENVKKILKDYEGKVLTYGFSKENDYVLSNLEENASTTNFTLNDEVYNISVLGKHNCLNAAAAIIVAQQLEIDKTMIQRALLTFIGTKRRLEYKGQLASGAFLYDDYAHHPTEIQSSLAALRGKYPNSHIVCIFQPHTYSRTKLLFDQFVDSFSDANEVIFTEIYPSAREEKDPSISSQQLSDKLSKKKKGVQVASSLENVVKYIQQQNYRDDTIIVTMGAGDIYKIAHTLEHESAPLE